VSEIVRKTRLPLRLLAGLFGVLLLAYLVRRTGFAKILESIATLGWGLILVILLGGVSHLVKTWAWRLTLLGERHQVSFPRMFGLRLASEAVGQVGLLGQVFGETLRVSLLSPTIPLASGITSVTLDRALFALTAAGVSIVGTVAVVVLLPLPHALRLYAGLFTLTLLGVILLTALAVLNRWPVFSRPAQVLGRLPYLSACMERKRLLIHSVESKLLDFYHHTPRSFWGSFTLNLACHAAAVFEVYLILWLMGAKISGFAALAVEALTKLVNIVGIFNPGNIGTYEGGNMLIVKLLGLSGAAGLTLALTRRLRALFWAAIGGLCLVALAKSKKRQNTDDSTHASIRVREDRILPPEPQKRIALGARSHIAIILAQNLHDGIGFGSRLPEVGSLPVLLRAILGAQKAGAARIVIVVDRITGSWVRSELLKTRRLPRFVEWFELGTGEASLASLLRQIAEGVKDHLVLIAGDGTYHPSLHRRVGEWNGEGDALALSTGSQLVGMYALSQNAAIDFANHGPSNALSLEELHDWTTSTYSVRCEPVEEEKWQRVLTSQQRQSAEKKLDSWLVKPTDGFYARLNRRVSIPISRQLIKCPITPNMVSIFTLGVGFACAVFFARGGYWNTLLGAFLCLLASILDGCDGEVARLKFLESDFGCWLETLCDYVFYLFLFVGMTIGQWRSSGTSATLVFGGLLLFGSVASLLANGWGRHRLAAERPEQLLGIWQAKAESRQSNPFLYFGRHTEFIIRRCFFPYALLFFAVFNIMNVAFILSGIGANLVWPIALYSSYTFAGTRGSTVASPATPA
jgi:uncharacterized protein (TIRG00374 family)